MVRNKLDGERLLEDVRIVERVAFWHIRKNSGQIFDLDGFSLYSRLMGHEPAHPVTKSGVLFSLVIG